MLQTDLLKLNAIAHEGHFPTKRLVDLTKGQRYMITSLKTVTSKYGQKVVAELESKYHLLMAKRVSEALVQDENFLTNLQDAANKCELFMIDNGGSSVEFSGKWL